MKQLLFSLTLLLYSIPNHAVELSVSHVVYYSEAEPYVEIYTRYFANSLLDSTGQKFTADQLEVILTISSGEEILVADKYNIHFQFEETLVDFWDLKKYKIKPGNYVLNIKVNELDGALNAFQYEGLINIKNNSHAKVCLSQPLIFSSIAKEEKSALPFRKYQFSYEPLSYNLYDFEDANIYFLTELSFIDQNWDEEFYISYAIMEGTADSVGQQKVIGYKKIQQYEFTPLLLSINTSNILSGNYTLVVEARDRNKNLLYNTTTALSIFHPAIDIAINAKSNRTYENSFVSDMDAMELNYNLKSIYSQVGQKQTDVLNDIIDSDAIEPKKYYLFNHWNRLAPADPEKVFKQFKSIADAIDKKYNNNVGYGFETDMGYIFMKYGKPNDIISVEEEPAAPPYEIWIYEHLQVTKQNNVKFLFYNPSLSGNDYTLLHSTCRGETFNKQWELELYRDSPNEVEDNTMDATRVGDNWNRNARRYFEDN